MIADEHKALIRADQKELILKQSMDALTKNSSFADGWSSLGARFANMIDYCGTIATLFHGTSTVESIYLVFTLEERCVPSSAI